MRNYILFGLAVLIFFFQPELRAQAPLGINYQGIARDFAGKPLAEKDISLRISILQGSATGATEYDEIHEVKTNSFGLFTLVIGNGVPGTGLFKFISWALGNKWLQIELDADGGRNFQLMGTQQLMSVPYALYAEFAGNGLQAGAGIDISNNRITNTGDGDNSSVNELITAVELGSDNTLRITDAGGTKEVDLGGLAGGAQNLSGVLTQGNNAGGQAIVNLANPVGAADAATKVYVDNHSDADADPLNEIQGLNDVLLIGSDAGGIKITNLGAPAANTDAATKQYVDGQDAADGDKSSNNEIQSLSKSGSIISLSLGGGTVNLSDDNPLNEIQTLAAQTVDADTRSLSISSGNVINVDVRDADASGTNEAQTLSKSGANISLSNVSGIGGGSIVLNDDSNTNEAQTITRTGSTVTLAQANGAGGGSFSVDDADANPVNEAQLLSKAGAVVSLTDVGGAGGGSFILNDDSNTNEAQTLSKSGANISLSNVSGIGGGSIVLNDDSNTNEAQTITRTGSTVTLAQANGAGGGSFSVDDADANPVNEAQLLSKAGAVVSLTDVSGAGGGSFILNDDSNTNEAQSISRTGSTVTLTQANGVGGGSFSVDDADANPVNEVQTLIKLGNTIVLSDVGGVGGGTINDAVDDADSNPTNEIQNLSLAGFNLSISSGNSVLLPFNSHAFQFNYNHSVLGSFTGNSPADIDLANVELDNSAALNVTTEEYVVPSNGVYGFFVYGTISGFSRVGVRVNGNDLTVRFVMSIPTAPLLTMGSVLINLNAGDRVQVVGEKIAVGTPGNMTGNFSGYKL